MSAATRLRTWWKALAHRSTLEKEMEAELRFHIESYAADLVRNGLQPEDALRRARLELGTIPSQQEDCRSSFGVRPWDDLLADLRYAFRQLRHTPAFTVTVLVAQRTREIGVRIALGAQRRDIMGILLGQAGRMLLAGAAIGIALAYLFGRLLAGFLFGVQPHDLGTLFAVTVLLLSCGLAAAYLPARTASRVDPMQALRGE
jgi:hypothetical protein